MVKPEEFHTKPLLGKWQQDISSIAEYETE